MSTHLMGKFLRGFLMVHHWDAKILHWVNQ